MFRKLFVINLSLFAAAVAGAVWLGEIWQGPLGEEIKTDPVPPKRIEREQYSFDKMAAGSGYGQMVDNDLFRPDRKRYIPPEPSPTPEKDDAKEDKKPNFEVLGIMLLNDRVKYAIVAEKPAKKVQAPKPKKRYSRRSRRRREKPKPTPTPSDLLQARSYRVGEEVKNGWYISEIRPTLVVFSNGKESFEVEVTKSTIPQVAEEKSKKTGRQPIKKIKPASPPSKDEATQRFLDALRKAGKRK